MARIRQNRDQLFYTQFPVTLAFLCVLLFVTFWVLALTVDTGLKALHYTLFNFLLVAILALQKHHRLFLDNERQQYRLRSIGLLSGIRRWEGDLGEISGLHIEPGFGGVKGSGGRLLLLRSNLPSLVLSSTDILPGAHRDLERVAEQIDGWLSEHRQGEKKGC